MKDPEAKPGGLRDPGAEAEEEAVGQEESGEPPQKERRTRETSESGSHRAGVVVLPATVKKDPHYLSRALQLRPCVKASARAEQGRSHRSRERPPREDLPREARSRRSPMSTSGGVAEGSHRHHGGGGIAEEPYSSRRSRDRTPERPPIVRRPRDPREVRKLQPKRKKSNKGQKRRDRGREYRGKKERQWTNRRGW